MEVGMNDSGIVIEKGKDVSIDVEKLKQGTNSSDSSSGGGSMSSSRSDDIAQVEEGFGKISEDKLHDDSLPPYSAISPNDSRAGLLHSSVIKKDDSCDKVDNGNRCTNVISNTIGKIKKFISDNKDVITRILIVIFIIWNLIWLTIAAVKDWNRCLPFFVIICLVIFFKTYSLIRTRYGMQIKRSVIRPCADSLSGYLRYGKWIFVALAAVSLCAWIIKDTCSRPHQFISILGYFIFLFLMFICSKFPGDVIWRPVVWGCCIQICMGLFILRTSAGFAFFNYIGKIVQIFLGFTKAGCVFVFGEAYVQHFFAFGVLPIIIYFSAFISILYHLGAMQWLILKIAWLMQVSLGTSATESMVAAGNIFVGQTESPLLIRPYIADLTTSELHAVMTAGFGTIAGSVLGAYLGFGIKSVYVITACVMAAPCALAVSKLLYPETKESKFVHSEGLELESNGHRNIIEAAFVGASQAIPLVLNIGANLIAFIAMLAAVNGFLGWYGSLVDIENLSFEFLCSFIFMPFSYLMGIEWSDCFKCAELIGTKIFLNEFIAYEKLSVLIDNKKAFLSRYNETTEEVNWISDRSEAVITYALCGFANLGSIGIMLGGLGAICPERQSEMVKIVLRALMGGVFVSFLNACIAGFLYSPPAVECSKIFSVPFESSEMGYVHQCCVYLAGNVTGNEDLCCNNTWLYGYSTIDGC